MRIFWMGLLTVACTRNETKEQIQEIDGELLLDADSDGFIAAEDCDDTNAAINDAAMEICDGIDNNCNGQVDEEVTTLFYGDSDGDGFGNEQLVVSTCEAPEGYVTTGTDCDDANADIYPSAEEICDGVDNDCNQQIDEDLMTEYFRKFSS